VAASERHSNERRFGLAELIDFEAQLSSDRDRPYRELMERDRHIALRWQDQPKTTREMLARWLGSLRIDSKAPTLGERVARAHAAVNWIAFLVFGLIGVGVALAVLQFTGDHPINVLIVLGVFVLLQLLNLVATTAAFAWSRFSPGFLAQLPVMALVRSLILRLAGPQDAGRFMARRSLYSGVERWVLFRTVQLGAVAFNVGALVTFIAAVAFTDLAFAWSTTLRVGSEGLQRFCEALALPWSAWFPDAVPTRELIHATQYFRLDGAYVNAPAGTRVEDAAATGGWWPFLLMCLLVYGLLPRLVLFVWGTLGMRFALERLPFDTPEEAEVIARLTTPRVCSVHERDPGNVAPLGRGLPPLAPPAPLGEDARALVVRWRDAVISEDVLSERLQRRLGAVVQEPVCRAGGRDHADDQATLARLEATPGHVIVIAEPWNAPDRAFQRFVRSVRKSSASNRKILVLLTEGGDEEQRAVWAGYLAELGDPYIALGDV
jgi:hypothetical protein